MESFEAYLDKKGIPDLFCDRDAWEFSFGNSANTPLIQLADLIAGTLSYCFDLTKKCEYTPSFREILRPHESGYDFWPFGKVEIPPIITGNEEELNDILKKTFCNKAIQFIENNEDSNDNDEQMQALVLKSLLMARMHEERADQAIYSNELIRRIKSSGHEDFLEHKQAFTARIIGRLRQAGIIISGSNVGYRLALSMSDIRDYLNHDRNIIEPMISRLKCAQETVKVITAGKYDILQQVGYENLKHFVDTFSDHQIESAVEPEADDI